MADAVGAQQADDPPLVMPAGLWEKLKSDPQYAPEHIALEAVNRLGPTAQAWLVTTRNRQPWLSADGAAQLVVKRFVKRARFSGAVSGLTGLPGATVDVGVLAWTQACMVLHLAAAYGVNPTDPQRAADLLVLQKVHRYAEGARTALEVAGGRQRVADLLAKNNTTMTRVFVRLGIRLARMAGIGAAKRLFAKAIPGASVVFGAWVNSSATKALARRAVAMYRPRY